MTRWCSRRAIAALLMVFVSSGSSVAHAAGFFLLDRGVRPMSRGGAFVAGADDLSSIWYNPAGLSEAGSQVMFDASLIFVQSSFQRSAYVPVSSTGGPMTIDYPRVEGHTPLLPIPTLAVSNTFGLKTWNFALGVHVPYAALTEWPETITNDNGETLPAPQRYTIISPKGTLFGALGLYVSKTFFDGALELGLGPELLLGKFSSVLALQSCPGAVACAEQDPNYDAYNKLDAAPIVSPSLAFGVTYRLRKAGEWRFGFSGHLPYFIDAPATIQVRKPTAALFRQAEVVGDEARLKFHLPWILRWGVEARPIKGLRAEVAAVFEGWAIHDEIAIKRSGRGIAFNNITGIGDYPIGDLSVKRNFRDTFSVRLGLEYGRDAGPVEWRLRAGFFYERAAVPKEYLAALTIDLDKVSPSLGASLHWNGLTVDLGYSAVIGLNGDVDPTTASLYAMNPMRADPIPQTAINGGQYRLSAHVLGLGLSYRWN